MPAVSIIIPAYNAARFVAEALESVLAQTRPVHEIIVVNDGSTDSTREVLERYRDRVRYVEQVNQGVSAARNAGVECASGDLAVFLDADDALAPGAVESLVHAATCGPEAVAYGDIVCFDEGTETTRILRRPEFAGPAPYPTQRMFRFGGLTPSAFLVPLKLARQVGGFDRRFSFAADLHFFLRCGCHASFVHVPEVVLTYRVHDGNMSKLCRSALTDPIAARLAFQEWCNAAGINCPVPQEDERSLMEKVIDLYYYGRDWKNLDLALQIARERGMMAPQFDRLRRLRRLPLWIFRVKDRLDHWTRQFRSRSVLETTAKER
jgi:glycosyltransferase involved in cell wall biosynthesis